MNAPAFDAIPRKHWIRLALAYLALGLGALWYAPDADLYSYWAHGLWCFAGLAVAAPTLLRASVNSFAVVLTDHRLTFLAAFSLYFLFGAALPAAGPEIQIERAMSLYPTDPGGALRVDAVNALGFGIALLAATVSRARWLGTQASRVAGYAARVPYHWVACFFMVLGVGATFYRIPFDLGLQQGNVSGAVRSLAQLSIVAVFLAAASRGSYERVLRWLGVALTMLLTVVGTMQFMKQEALYPLVALSAGLALRFGSRRVLPFALAFIVAGFGLLGTLVNYGRIAVGNARDSSTLAERWSYFQEGWTNTRDLDESQQYGYWQRLCYVPTQVASLDFQDEGRGGDGMQLMWWVFVPRAVAPQKPQMTRMFAELNEKITGSDQSSNSPGIFVSGYYHAGWWGVVFASFLCGWILAQTSAIARAVHTHQAALMVPFSLLGIYIASRIDGDFIPDYLGLFVFVLYPFVAAAVMMSATRSSRRA